MQNITLSRMIDWRWWIIIDSSVSSVNHIGLTESTPYKKKNSKYKFYWLMSDKKIEQQDLHQELSKETKDNYYCHWFHRCCLFVLFYHEKQALGQNVARQIVADISLRTNRRTDKMSQDKTLQDKTLQGQIVARTNRCKDKSSHEQNVATHFQV